MLQDDEPRDDRRPGAEPLLTRPPLDRLGVAELQAYIEALQSEIARAEAEIARKKALLDAAHTLFGSR